MKTDSVQMIEAPSGTSSHSLVAAFFLHRSLFLRTVAVIFCLSLVITFLPGRRYVSSMSLLVRNARGNYLITPERTTAPAVVSEVSEEQINSEAAIAESHDILDQVVDPNWSNTAASQRSTKDLKAHEKAITALRKHLSIEPGRKTHLIDISLTADSPEAAHAGLERLLSLYMAKQRELARPTGAYRFFAGEAARYKGELEAAQAKLSDYQQQRQLVSVGDKEATLERQITTLDDELRDADVKVSETRDRIVTGVHQLEIIPRRHSTEQRQLPNQLWVQQLGTMLATYQNKRTELLTRYQPTDRLVQEVDKQIADTQVTLQKAQAENAEETATDVNPVWQQADGALQQNRAEIEALKARRSQIAAELASLNGDLGKVEGSTVEFAALQRRVAELENNYQLYSQKRDETQIADAMDAQSLLNVAVVQQPTYSAVPAKPVPVRDTFFGAFTALFLGGFAVFMAETSRRTLETPAELQAITRYPILATVPFVSAHDMARRPPGLPGVPAMIFASAAPGSRLRRFALFRDRRSA